MEELETEKTNQKTKKAAFAPQFFLIKKI